METNELSQSRVLRGETHTLAGKEYIHVRGDSTNLGLKKLFASCL